MTGIVLSASVRQNLLSLQSTASLLATTQNDLATGNKVNSALDNPTSYFTAAALNNRASDISNLLDGIGNGVQVLQAANTGITSLQSLVASAQSVANQVLQTPVGYSTKSAVSTIAISGATANNLLGTGTGFTDATFAGATATGTVTTAFTNASATGTAVNNDDTTTAPISSATLLVGTAGTTSNDLATAITDGSTLVVNGVTITFSTATTSSSGSAASGFTIGIGAGSTASVATVLSDIDAITGSGTGFVGDRRQARAADRHHRQPDRHRQRQRAGRTRPRLGRHPDPRRRRDLDHGAGRHRAAVRHQRVGGRRIDHRLHRRRYADG